MHECGLGYDPMLCFLSYNCSRPVPAGYHASVLCTCSAFYEDLADTAPEHASVLCTC